MPYAARLYALAERLRARAQPPRPSDLVPFVVADHAVGWVAPAVSSFLVEQAHGFEHRHQTLRLISSDPVHCGRLLNEAAARLRDAGLLRGWRNEALAVRAQCGGPVLATVERAAFRPLGITTEAVHLNAFADDGTLLVARRAAHKSIDPGLWDNLVGGMVPADETLEQALEREAWEEAGLSLDRIEVHHGRRFHVRRSVPEGYQSEVIHVYDATLGADTICANQDGEVDVIERRELPALLEALEREEFTLESALATLETLTRRSGCATPPGLYD
ncbi:MAG TPA: DUF4743 domain-containing protein [Burkholderiaceae bacterium]|nr:DUF4743 domain-containing protein [Burkholderiaceae bacterium]